MSSFAKKMARKAKKARREGVEKGQRVAVKASRDVKHSYLLQNCRETLTRREALRNLSAVFLYAMHRDAGFGAKGGPKSRLYRLRDKMQSVFDCIVSKNVTIHEISDYLRNDIELDVDIITCDPKADWLRKIEHKAVQEMEAAFLMALIDAFGYKKKRLEVAYMYCAKLSTELKEGKLTYQYIRHEIEKIMTIKKAA
jgi:hypothetical protein